MWREQAVLQHQGPEKALCDRVLILKAVVGRLAHHGSGDDHMLDCRGSNTGYYLTGGVLYCCGPKTGVLAWRLLWPPTGCENVCAMTTAGLEWPGVRLCLRLYNPSVVGCRAGGNGPLVVAMWICECEM